MSNERRFDRPNVRPEYARGARYQTGGDRYRTGSEQRYWPEREQSGAGREGGSYEGDRRYGQGGYREETGYREFDNAGWGRDDQDEQYFGTGSHYGGGFGSAPGSRASSAGTMGAPGYAAGGAWTDPADWSPEDRSDSGSASHRGRGPKGYMRSDERLRETICDRLTDDPRIDASEIEVDVKGQTVTLRGTVDDRRTKYAVEELVEGCGAREVENQLRVTQKGW